jgi:hypothetical protein
MFSLGQPGGLHKKNGQRHARQFTRVCFGIILTGCCIMISAQDMNPPYPRLGIFTFSGSTDACVDVFQYFDIIATPPNVEMAQKYLSAYPNKTLLGTSGALLAYEIPNIPEVWYYHDINGERITLFGDYWLMNLTTLCPRVDMGDGAGPVQYIEYAAKNVQSEIDFNTYDGVFYDWWWWGPGYDAKVRGDLDGNGVSDRDEWGIDSLRVVWQQGVIQFHELTRQIPGNQYEVVQVGSDDPVIWQYFNGACFEDWPIYNGPWERWRKYYNDTKTTTRLPKIMIFDSAISHYNNSFPTTPYKNNYRSVRFGLSSCLLTSAYFYVDEGGQIAHHGNVHIYDEFETKGQMGYPRTDMIKIEGKTIASTTPYASGVWLRFFDSGISLVNATGLTQNISASEIAALDPVSGSRYYRFRGGQDPIFNNGEEVTDVNTLELWGDTHTANWGTTLEVFGDGALLFRSPKIFVTPIIVDNNENNQTSPGSEPVSYAGSWIPDSNGEKYYAIYTDRDYGPFQPSAFAWSSAGSGENTARYTPTIGLSGLYEVLEWHGYLGSAPSADLSSDVPARIVYDGGQTQTVTIDQARNFGKWNSLGTYIFRQGSAGYVELSNNTGGIVISDAIKFVLQSPVDFDSQAPGAPQGVEVR